MRAKHIITVFLMLITAIGCSTTHGWPNHHRQMPVRHMTLKQRQQQLERIHGWNAQGAISITFHNKTDIGSFNWKQRGRTYSFRTSGPMNLTGWRIDGRPGRVVLYKNANTRVVARTPESLMHSQLGWHIPMGNFRYWSRGLAAPDVGTQAIKRDRYGHLRLLRQQGWTIHYLNYTHAAGRDLPRTMLFLNHRVRIKLVIKRWQITRA